MGNSLARPRIQTVQLSVSAQAKGVTAIKTALIILTRMDVVSELF